ncbi:MAG: Gfo/Idh/MocA family oxidoreductase [Phycisphaerales bacterium]|nr:MAG: Gfo/Idh/MocA family oxidoreductase [Phycisphaerales bacterium]
MDTHESDRRMDRRRFLYSTTALGAGLTLAPAVLSAAKSTKKPETLNVALIGAGAQGKVLMEAAIRVPGVRFPAVCDIWPYNRKWVSGRLRAYRHPNNKYEDYREMLAQEKDLDAVIIASPDCFHAEHTIACLEAGLHVYCEKEMSNTLEGARRMVEAARRTDKLLQIGHQRRSNPRYIFCRDKLLKELKLLGRITAINGQWNRSVHDPEGWPKGSAMDAAALKRYGYESMHQLRNWRWYKHLGGGPIVDLGSHQIDIYNWFLGAQPTSVLASGRTNYYDKKTHEWYDTVMAIYEYDVPQGSVSAYYQTITTNSSQGYFETFMGHEGTLLMSEKAARCRVYRESWVDESKWDPWVRKGYLSEPEVPKPATPKPSGVALNVGESIPAPSYKLLLDVIERVHQPHLQNFFDAIRGRAQLTCPAEIGYETAVTVLKVNEAAAAGRKLDFKPRDFVVS